MSTLLDYAQRQIRMSGPAAPTTDYRLYISGHPIGITEAQLAARFSSFGVITKVDRLDQSDGNGDPSRYSFLTLRTDQAKLSKCVALLSGSTWKGNILRIALAKPDYKERMAKERAAAELEAKQKPKKDKRKKQKELRGVDGKEGPNQALVDEKTVEGLPGWRKSADKKHLVYPITTRPSHPLPDQPAEATKKRKKVKETDPESIKALSRAKRVKIDPVKWQPTHLKGEKAIVNNVDTEASTKQSKKATKAPKQPIKAKSPTPSASSSSSESEDSPEALSEHEVETLKESLDENLLASERTSQLALLNSLLASQPKASSTSVEAALDTTKHDEEMPNVNAFEPIVEDFTVEPAPEDKVSKKKKKRKEVTIQPEPEVIEPAVQVEEPVAPVQPKKRKVILPSAVPQPESSTWKAVQRYIPEEPVEPESEEAVVQELPEEEIVPSEMQEDEADLAEENVNMTSLKDMFKPQEADQGFSLFDALAPFDLDADPFSANVDAEEPYTAPSRAKRPLAQVQPVKEAPQTTMFDQDEPLFFPLFLPQDEERLGLHLDDEQRARLEARSWTSGSGRRFRPLGSKQEREERHTERRGRLTEQIRKRHREAVRKQKRRTGDA